MLADTILENAKLEQRLDKLEQQMKNHTHTNYGYEKPTVSNKESVEQQKVSQFYGKLGGKESVEKSCGNCGEKAYCCRKATVCNYWQPKDKEPDECKTCDTHIDCLAMLAVIKEVYYLSDMRLLQGKGMECRLKEIAEKLKPYIEE